jgi:hypothetical protein
LSRSFQRAGRQPGRLQHLVDVGKQGVVTKLVREQIDADAAKRKSLSAPFRRRRARGLHDPAAHRRRDRARRQCVDEDARRKNAAFGMAPADQRFSADDGLV